MAEFIRFPIRGGEVLIDEDDLPLVEPFSWWLSGGRSGLYATRYDTGLRKAEYMHRYLLNAPAGLHVDHINGNRLDNRRSNLRLCLQSQNQMNAPRRPSNRSGYKGVYLNRKSGTWSAQIKAFGVTYHLGTFPTAETAARAYDEGARLHHGSFARVNFP